MSFSWSITLWDEDVTPVDHEVQGLSRFGWQYKASPRLNSFLGAFLAEVQSLELVARSMVAQRWPYTAVGVQLDTIGKLIVYDRTSGMTDDEYRLFCICKIFANKSDCHPEDIIKLLVLARLGKTGEILRYHEIYPNEINIEVTDCEYVNTVFILLGFVQPGGVMMDFIYSEESYEDTLRMNDDLSTITQSANHGFGWSGDPTIGGVWAGVKRQ